MIPKDSATMPTLCGNVGPLPESYRKFLNADGDLQVGDAFGLEAQWILSQVTLFDRTYYPQQDWSCSEIEADERGVGCVRCGDEECDTVRGLCEECS